MAKEILNEAKMRIDAHHYSKQAYRILIPVRSPLLCWMHRHGPHGYDLAVLIPWTWLVLRIDTRY